MKIRREVQSQKNELNMTSMIDIVFLLLIFFVMTFKIVEMEGDFSIRMPLAGDGAAADPTDLPLKLRLRADANGSLTSMSLNEINLGTNFDQLRANVVSLIGTGASRRWRGRSRIGDRHRLQPPLCLCDSIDHCRQRLQGR